MGIRLRYNAPVILTLTIIATAVLLIDQLTGGSFIRTYFTIYPNFNVRSALSWLTLFSYVIGSQSWNHLISNFSFILLIGPVLEEKYGSVPLLLMMLVTAVTTGVLNILLVRTGLLGASGIVFMLILLSSFTNIRQGEIPITFILIVALYLVREFINALTPDTISQLAHIAGGVVGGLFGFAFAAKEKATAVPAVPGEKED